MNIDIFSLDKKFYERELQESRIRNTPRENRKYNEKEK